MKLENIDPEKKKLIAWNGEINVGNILTIAVLIIAYLGLSYQKKLVETKVEDLQVVVSQLEEEKLVRELQGLKNNEHSNNAFNYTLDYTINQFRATGKIQSYESIFILLELNEIIDILLKRKDLSLNERKKIELLKQRNLKKQEIYAHTDIYGDKILEFQKKFEPSEADYKNLNLYLTAETKYIDTLQKHINVLQNILDSLLKEPIAKVKKIEENYIQLQNKK